MPKKLKEYEFHILDEIVYNIYNKKAAICDANIDIQYLFHFDSVSHAYLTRLAESRQMICPECLKVINKVFGINTEAVTRVEVIDNNGRSYVNNNNNNNVDLSFQDKGRTLKVIINQNAQK